MTLVIEGGCVATLGDSNRIINPGAVVIEGKNVKEIGPLDQIKLKYRQADTIYAKRKVIMPAFVNTHHHLYSTFARGMAVPGPAPENFQQILENLWWKLDKVLFREAIYYSSLVPLMESLKQGVTSIIDHHESQSYQIGSLDEIKKAVEESGMKALICLGASDRYGNGERGLEENERFLRKKSDNVRGMVGLHASFTVSEQTLKRSFELASEFECGVHVHCCEAPEDGEITRQKYSSGVVERFRQAGILGPKTLLVHGVHIDHKDMDIIKSSGSSVIHNPESNMNNAVGYAKILDMMEKGIKVGLGTDGMSSDMLSQMRTAFLLARHEYRDPSAAFSQTVEMLLKNNPEIFTKISGWEAGEIVPGNPADIAVINYDPPTPLSQDNFMGHLMFGMVSANVDSTICNGRPLMKHGKIMSIDEPEVLLKSRKIAERIWKRIS